MSRLVFLLAAGPLLAGDAKVWSTAEIAKRFGAAKTEAHHYTGASLENEGTYRLSVAKREASGVAELHGKVNDIFMVESGEATLILGGKILGAKAPAANEVRGHSIEGGTKRKLAAGDIVHIPANTPHQMLLAEGKQITYVVVKVDVR